MSLAAREQGGSLDGSRDWIDLIRARIALANENAFADPGRVKAVFARWGVAVEGEAGVDGWSPESCRFVRCASGSGD